MGLLETQGAADSLALQSDPKSVLDLGFVQCSADETPAQATGPDGQREATLALRGSQFYGPVWLF